MSGTRHCPPRYRWPRQEFGEGLGGFLSDRDARGLREKAAKARQFASFAFGDQKLIATLESYAQELEEEARKLEAEKIVTLSNNALEPASTNAVAALKSE